MIKTALEIIIKTRSRAAELYSGTGGEEVGEEVGEELGGAVCRRVGVGSVAIESVGVGDGFGVGSEDGNSDVGVGVDVGLRVGLGIGEGV